MELDEAGIRQLHDTWIDAVNRGDLACLLDLMADDVVFLNPGRPPVGKDGFPAGFRGAHDRFELRCRSDLEEVVVVGDFAYARSRDSLSLRSRQGAEPTVRLQGDRLTIYRRQADGRWRLARDAHTLSPEAG